MVQLLPLRRRGATRFFTLSLAEERATTLVDDILHLRATVRAVQQQLPFEIDAWVVMPDHLHAILTLPHGDNDFAARWDAIKMRFARDVSQSALTPNQILAGPDHLWEKGLEAQPTEIEDRNDLAAYRLQCWMDPVRHGFVTAPEDWSYSSYHRDAQAGARDVTCAFGLSFTTVRKPMVVALAP